MCQPYTVSVFASAPLTTAFRPHPVHQSCPLALPQETRQMDFFSSVASPPPTNTIISVGEEVSVTPSKPPTYIRLPYAKGSTAGHAAVMR